MSAEKPIQPQQQPWTPVSLTIAIVVGIGLFLLLGQVLIWIGGSISRFQAGQEAKKAIATSSMDHDAKWKAMQAKVTGDVVAPLDRKYDPEGYTKLGKGVWGVSNEFRRWAALSAAQSDSCDKVDAVAVWKRATRADLSWRVACRNGEVFIIPERQARSVRAQFDPAAATDDRERFAALAQVVQPVSAVWKNFNQAGAIRTCEGLIEEAAVDRNSFETSGVPEVQRDDEAGRASIYGHFSSDNAMGGTISGRYKCTVDASGAGRVLSVKTRDVFGIHIIY